MADCGGKPDFSQVDAEIRQLVVELNAAGFVTFSLCQGKRSIDDFILA